MKMMNIIIYFVKLEKGTLKHANNIKKTNGSTDYFNIKIIYI